MRISDWSSDGCSSDLKGSDFHGSLNGDERSQPSGVVSIVSSRGRSAGRQRLAVAIMNRQPAATAAKVRMEKLPARSEESRVGTECVSTVRYWGTPYHEKKQTKE